MLIQEEDFILTPIKPDYPLFDVDLLQTVNKGKSNERKEFKNVAYGVSLDYAITMIISNRISSNYETLTLKEYILKFREGIDELKKLCYGDLKR